MVTETILIVEDDLSLSEGLCLALKGADTKIFACAGIAVARQKLSDDKIDLVLLDINLPDGNGLDFLREIKGTQAIPVILLTAKDTELDIVTGLDTGADDYVVKPFSLAILRARVNAQLRKGQPGASTYAQGDYAFDFTRMLFTHCGRPVELSKTEQKLLRILVENRGQALTRNLLFERVWDDGKDFVDENTLSVAIKRLRDKLEAHAVLKTIYGVGYSWEMAG